MSRSSSARSSSRRRSSFSRSLAAVVDVGLRQLGEARLEPVLQHFGVAHLAEDRPEPLQLDADRLAPLLVEQRPEGAQVGSQAAGGDPRLVDVLRVTPETDPRVVDEQPEGRGGDRRLHDLGRGGREVERRGRRDVGWIGGTRPERAHDLRHRVGLAGAGSPESGEERGFHGLRSVRFELDLELPEPRRQADAVEHGHLVVDDFADLRTLLVAQHHARAHGVEARDRLERGAAGERVHQIERRLGRVVVGIAVEVQLLAIERPRVLRDRQLHGPAFGVAVAQARARACETEVVGVVVDGLETDRVGRVGLHAREGGQVGDPEERSR